MTAIDASASGQFKLTPDQTVHRLGFGAMRITGKGVWGEPENPSEAARVLRRLPELSINFIDTADSYGPEVSERLIRETLYPYDGLLIATKGGLERSGPFQWEPNGRPEYLRTCIEGSLKRLGVERIDLWQLHRIDPRVPRDEQLEAVAEFRKEGLIRDLGLSEVSVEDIEAAGKLFPVTSVQNLYNLAERSSEDVLDHCAAHNIGFIPWYPLANGKLADPGGALASIAAKHNATPSQIALAWLLKRSPVMLPIPGTGRLAHLEENTKAAAIELSDQDFKVLQNA
jgi:pyridoxine 4-dehydrogenase